MSLNLLSTKHVAHMRWNKVLTAHGDGEYTMAYRCEQFPDVRKLVRVRFDGKALGRTFIFRDKRVSTLIELRDEINSMLIDHFMQTGETVRLI